MGELAGAFEASAARVSSGAIGKVGRVDQLRLYGLFCVSRKGPAVAADKPSPYIDPRGSAKWGAWEAESVFSRCVTLISVRECWVSDGAVRCSRN
jgi:acyl-CoA-binding protein